MPVKKFKHGTPAWLDVATSVGCEGMEDLIGRGVVVADTTGLSELAAEGLATASLLIGSQEQAVLNEMARYPEALEQSAVNRAPHTLVHYLRDLANTLHTYYNAEQFIVTDSKLRNARLALVLGVQQVLRNGLTLLGVSAPESM